MDASDKRFFQNLTSDSMRGPCLTVPVRRRLCTGTHRKPNFQKCEVKVYVRKYSHQSYPNPKPLTLSLMSGSSRYLIIRKEDLQLPLWACLYNNLA